MFVSIQLMIETKYLIVVALAAHVISRLWADYCCDMDWCTATMPIGRHVKV